MASKDRFSIAGKTAIVTGASSGLGVAFADVLAEAGANVVLVARREDRLAEVANGLARYESGVFTCRCDVAEPEDVKAMVAAAWERFGRVDILVNNAGISAEAGFMPEKTPDDLFMATVKTNLGGLFTCCREVGVRQLADGKGGSLVNIASILGINGSPHIVSAYQAAKAGVINLTRNLGTSWADRGVRVNAIAPGWFPSEMTGPWFAVPQYLARFKESIPMGRVGGLEELSGALLYLASDASSYVTGQTIVVDGGLSATMGAAAYPQELFDVTTAIMGDVGTRILPQP